MGSSNYYQMVVYGQFRGSWLKKVWEPEGHQSMGCFLRGQWIYAKMSMTVVWYGDFFFSQYTWSALEMVTWICFSVQAEQLLEWLPWHFHVPQRMTPTGVDDPWFSSGTISSCDIVNPPRHISFFLSVFFHGVLLFLIKIWTLCSLYIFQQ